VKTYVFLDLDDTVFRSHRKCPNPAGLEAVEFLDGRPISYMSPRQRTLFDRLARHTIIPTTARSHSAFRRVQLPFMSYVILDFGGVVLSPTGEIDADWDGLMRPQAAAAEPGLQAALERVLRWNDDHSAGLRPRLISDFDMPLYLVVKHPEVDLAKLRALAESDAWPRGPEWRTHMNGNNLSLVPRHLGKEHAVRYVMESHLDAERSLILGCADSTSDASYLQLCDYAIIPGGSQLADSIGAESSSAESLNRGDDRPPRKNNGTAPSAAAEGGTPAREPAS
jgi:hydroxymethylpyrimidine pyrophosphatase-like HAD family hydrolase